MRPEVPAPSFVREILEVFNSAKNRSTAPTNVDTRASTRGSSRPPSSASSTGLYGASGPLDLLRPNDAPRPAFPSALHPRGRPVGPGLFASDELGRLVMAFCRPTPFLATSCAWTSECRGGRAVRFSRPSQPPPDCSGGRYGAARTRSCPPAAPPTGRIWSRQCLGDGPDSQASPVHPSSTWTPAKRRAERGEGVLSAKAEPS